MHKAIFKNGFDNSSLPICNTVQRSELSLHIRWESRIGSGTNIDSFRTSAFHIQGDPILTDFNFCSSLFQLEQYRFQLIGIGILEFDTTTSNCCRHQISTGFNTIWKNRIVSTVEFFNPFNLNRCRTGTGNFRAHLIQVFGQINNFRLSRRIFNYGCTFSQRCRHHQVFSTGYRDLIHKDMGTLEAFATGRSNVTVFHFNFCAHLLQTTQMQIHWTRTNRTAARQRYIRFTETGQ